MPRSKLYSRINCIRVGSDAACDDTVDICRWHNARSPTRYQTHCDVTPPASQPETQQLVPIQPSMHPSIHHAYAPPRALHARHSGKVNYSAYSVSSLAHKAQWLLYVPTGVTFANSTFCPHSVFMCFVWISEQTAIISLYSIN
jgi:hypothetical protein